MNGDEIKRIVDAIHRDKAIDPEIVFEGIEQAILSAARKHFSEEEDLQVKIDRDTCLLYTSPSPRDRTRSRMPSSA